MYDFKASTRLLSSRILMLLPMSTWEGDSGLASRQLLCIQACMREASVGYISWSFVQLTCCRCDLHIQEPRYMYTSRDAAILRPSCLGWSFMHLITLIDNHLRILGIQS